MPVLIPEKRDCPDCDVTPGSVHDEGCDVERCSVCGGQWLSCGDVDHVPEDEPWTGIWPGVVEAIDLGWFTKMGPNGWERCGPDDPEARPDLNRYAEYTMCVHAGYPTDLFSQIENRGLTGSGRAATVRVRCVLAKR